MCASSCFGMFMVMLLVIVKYACMINKLFYYSHLHNKLWSSLEVCQKKHFFCDRNIENGLASTEMWIDLHAYVKCFRARFILSSSWFIDWVTFWYFSLTQHLSLNRNILFGKCDVVLFFNNYFVLFYVCFIVLFSLNVFIQSTRV